MLALTREELAPTDTTDAAIEAIVALGHPRDRRARPARARAGSVDVDGARRARRPRRRRRGRGSRRARARSRERGRARSRLEHRPAQRRDPARVRHARADRQAARRAAPIPCRRPSRSSARSASRRVEIVQNRLEPDESGSVRAVPTDEREVIPCGLVFRSVGYHGVGVPGTPFDERAGTMPNVAGRVLGETARRSPACTAQAGSSAGRPASSARTRRTRPRRSSSCSRTRGPGGFPRVRRESDRRRSSPSACRGRHVRGLGGDRRGREGARRAARAPSRQARHLGRAARGCALRPESTSSRSLDVAVVL